MFTVRTTKCCGGGIVAYWAYNIVSIFFYKIVKKLTLFKKCSRFFDGINNKLIPLFPEN